MKFITLKKLATSILLALFVSGMLAPLFAAPAGGQAVASVEQPTTATLAPTPPTPGAQLLAADDRGITLELRTPDYTLTEQPLDGGVCQQLAAPDYATSDVAGAPALPVRGAMVGIPADVNVTLTVLEVERTRLPGVYALCPVPTPIVDFSPEGLPDYQGYAATRDAVVYSRNVLTPTTAAVLVETGFIRSQRFAQVQFHPFQYNPVTGELRQLTRIRVRLNFRFVNGPTTQRWVTGGDEGPFENVLQSALLNYDQAREWRVRPAPAATPASAAPTATTPTYKLYVNADGIYRVTRADLEAAGANLTGVDPRTFRLINQGQDVAIWVEGEGDGVFGYEDALLFYGQGLDTKYTDTNVYWLTWGGVNGLRMAEIDGTPNGSEQTPEYFHTALHLEENLIYQSKLSSGPNEDHWYWNDVYVTDGVPRSNNYTFTLPYVATPPLSATVRGLIMSYGAEPAHHTQILLNGYLLLDNTWPPNTEYAFEVSVPHAYVLPITNTLTLRAGISVTQDIPFINWFEIDYYAPYHAVGDQLAFGGDITGTWEYAVSGFTTHTVTLLDITNPLAPARFTGATLTAGGSYTLTFRQTETTPRRYLALTPALYRLPTAIVLDQPSTWRSTANGADYIIISPAEFLTTLQPLVAQRQARGLRVALVDVQDVYDEFAGSVFTPEAIRDFVSYAYSHWSAPAPAYVLLVGDGHLDYRDYYGRGQISYIPPYLAFVDPWMGETAADNRYVAVAGDDIFPDLHLGRLPARTAAEVAVMVNKILTYEDAPPAAWQSQTLFIADNLDSAGDFAAMSDALVYGHLPAPYQANKVYLYVTHANATLARTAIKNALNAGQLIVNYIGHGSVQFWAAEKLMDFSLLDTFTNTQRLPLFLPMNCYEGYYIMPDSPPFNLQAFGETVVRKSGGGAIASWSPTGLGVAAGHDYLNRGIFDAFFLEDILQLGPATTAGKLYLYANSGEHQDLLDTYILFGDPALALNVLPADVSITKAVTPDTPLYPGDVLTYTLTFTNAGPATAHHVVITDLLPQGLLTPTVTYAGVAATPRPGDPFVWDVADLPVGTGGTITLTAQIDPRWPWPITNTASIATSAVETNTLNNTTEPRITDILVPELQLHKTGTTFTRSGEPVTYTLAFQNNGAAPATGVVLTDLLPAQLISPTFTFTGALVTPRPGLTYTWDVADLSVGAGGSVTITAFVSPDFYQGSLTNNASLTAAEPERNTANNAARLVTGVYISDLWLTLNGPASVTWGSNVTYTLRYGNAGNDIAASVVLTTVFPTALLSPTVAWSGPEPFLRSGSWLAWDLGDLAPGAGGALTLTGRLSETHITPFSNSAAITTTSLERQLEDNLAGPLTTRVLLPDLDLHLQGPTSIDIGSRLTYTLSIHNSGAALARQVVVTDSVTPELQAVTITWDGTPPAQQSTAPYVWTLGDLPAGTNRTVVISGQLPPTQTGTLQHTAAITTTAPETYTTNNTASLTTAILQPELSVEKFGPEEVRPGEPVTYVIVYQNTGGAPAREVVLTDTLITPPGAAIQAANLSRRTAPNGAGTWVWPLGTLAPGATGRITITLTLDDLLEGVVTNTVSIATGTLEPSHANNADQVITAIVPYRRYLPLITQATP